MFLKLDQDTVVNVFDGTQSHSLRVYEGEVLRILDNNVYWKDDDGTWNLTDDVPAFHMKEGHEVPTEDG